MSTPGEAAVAVQGGVGEEAMAAAEEEEGGGGGGGGGARRSPHPPSPHPCSIIVSAWDLLDPVGADDQAADLLRECVAEEPRSCTTDH